MELILPIFPVGVVELILLTFPVRGHGVFSYSYKEHFARLRDLKTEIEHLQHFLEKSKVQLMKDFELWWAEQTSHMESQQASLQDNVR